jgi:Mn2+/Fe2+ NRAMP family transporter
MLLDARAKGRGATFKAFLRLSGPGWLQSGITLGGGSLSSCLYLGTLVGFSFLWLQPIAMILGIVMLSAIAYVALSTGRRPFGAINEHVNPVLGWGWLLAAMMANMIWSMPQFGLGIAAIR